MPNNVATRVFKRIVHHRHCSNVSHPHVTHDLRALLRETAQPVAVVTSFMPKTSQHLDHSPKSLYHGATLSSFTSIAMDPYPLIAFALRIPSRMATSLKSASLEQASHLVINLLSAEQASVATTFSKPDLHPRPFEVVPFTLTEEGLPMLEGSLGAISCKLVSMALPLYDIKYLEQTGLGNGRSMPEPALQIRGAASELFLARVMRVEKTILDDSTDSQRLPLLYHRRDYTTVSPIPSWTP
ncbi:hypothetical protein AMATHDRAFT_73452 [Amanita thiersii Skay4041]|uniref:Flavin reductase like domain-containing protein n=1 Tax=Amanita thiersii Skay4041 TaxID=703135 RepID=A0A2A9NXP9_9AGAR|nr:hypothetical protein AMATHDRAFT_73452 [Amanita thiersii Skay4041]